MDLFAPQPTDNLLPYDGIVNDFGVVLNNDKALYNQLVNELLWQADKVSVFGKTHITTRKIVWMGDTQPDKELTYTYSGHTRHILPWHIDVLQLKQVVERQLDKIGVNVSFNTCLLNYYPSGQDGMGYHADDEPELGPLPIIASLSLGATRKFVLKHRVSKHNVEMLLESGQLIVMRGVTQRFWKHTITKTKLVNDGRISLTFRQMLN